MHQYQMINVIEGLDQVGMLFLSDLSRQECSTHTTTSQQEFDVPDSPTRHGGEKGFSQTTNTRWRQDTRCVGHEIALLSRVRGKTEHLLAPHRSPRRTQKTRLALHRVRGGQEIKQVSYFTEYADGPNKGFCTPRSAQETRIRTAQSARTQTCSRQSLPSGDGAIYQDTEHNTKEDDNE